MINFPFLLYSGWIEKKMMLMVISFASKEARYSQMKGRCRGNDFLVYWDKFAEERSSEGERQKERKREKGCQGG